MRNTRRACTQFVSSYLLILGAIVLTGCGTTGPIDQHGNTVTPEQERKYALLVLGDEENKERGFVDYGYNDSPLLTNYSLKTFPTELNVEPGSHRVGVNNSGSYLHYELTVEAGLRYVIPKMGDLIRERGEICSTADEIVVSRRDDPNHRELYRLPAKGSICYRSFTFMSNEQRLALIEEQRANKEADAKRLLAEEKKLAYQKALPALLEKAWACAPILHTEKVVNWKFRQAKNGGQLETKNDAYERLHQALLEFRECQNQAGTEQLRRVFMREYVCGYVWQGIIDGGPNNRNWESRDAEDWEPRSWEWDKSEDTILNKVILCDGQRDGLTKTMYTQDFSEHEWPRRQRELALRKVGLKSGEIAVANFDDAMLVLEPKQLDQIMVSPLLKADNNIYAAEVRVDGNDERMLRVARGGGRNFIGEWVAVSYAHLKISKSVTKYLKSEMRIGGVVKVIGRYVGNTEYRTIGGEVKVMPILDVMYLGN